MRDFTVEEYACASQIVAREAQLLVSEDAAERRVAAATIAQAMHTLKLADPLIDEHASRAEEPVAGRTDALGHGGRCLRTGQPSA